MENLIVLIYFIIGIIYCIYYWYKYYDHDYKKLKRECNVEDGMACNLIICIIAFWPICFTMDIWNISKKICDKYNKMINK